SKSPVLINQGDHDNGRYRSDNRVITEEELKKDYRTAKLLAGEVRNGDSIYCYKDFPESKIRVVIINTNDVPYILDNGVPRYKQLNTLGLRHEQLNWLANKALQLPFNDWHVIVFGHNPLHGVFGLDKTFYNSN